MRISHAGGIKTGFRDLAFKLSFQTLFLNFYCSKAYPPSQRIEAGLPLNEADYGAIVPIFQFATIQLATRLTLFPANLILFWNDEMSTKVHYRSNSLSPRC